MSLLFIKIHIEKVVERGTNNHPFSNFGQSDKINAAFHEKPRQSKAGFFNGERRL
jgi:hypothetical protein